MPFVDIRAYFIQTKSSNESCASDGGAGNSNSADSSSICFENAIKMMQQHIPEESIRKMRASEAYALIASGKLTKKDVFILDHFEGDFFKQLQSTKALIVGPPCIVTCIMMLEPIPLGTSPVFSTAMRNLQISASSLTAAEKESIRTQIQWMGGHYFQNLGRSITHLISNSIKSSKYEHATLNGIPVMHVDWVQKVWERSCSDVKIQATDEEFDKYRLPIFFGANITCTGLDSEKKNKVMRIVNDNGGTYHRAFRSQLVDIVITEQSKTNTEKYKAALRFNKEILLPEWIFDSEQKGYALPTKGYIVRAHKEVSTPTKSFQATSDQSQLAEISCINHVPNAQRMGSNVTTVDETMCSSLNNSVASVTLAKTSKDLLKKATTTSANAHYRKAFEEISARQAKKAGSFLDGCSIYLGGFLSEEREKLNRILNAGGATRYDELNSEVTHIIVGQLNDGEMRNWQKAGLISNIQIVRLDWLLECIKVGHFINEAPYRIPMPTAQEPDMPSPTSKRTLRSMNNSFKQPELPVKKKLFNGMETTTAGGVGRDSSAAKRYKGNLPLAQSTEIPTIDNNNDYADAEDEHNLITQYSQENEAAAGAPLPPATTVTASEHDQTISQAPPVASSTQINIAATTVNAIKDVAVASDAPQAQLAADLAASGMASIDFDKLDYFQGAAVYIHESHFPDYYTQMISECEAAHGNIVSQSFADPVDYAIVSFERICDESQLPVKARHVVTELYVESCIKENKLVPIDYYHRPVPHTAESTPLEGMVIVISIYSGLERDFIDSLAQLLGAKVNKAFMKREKPLLVCSSPEGSKYNGAIKWCYPVVNSQWLVQCAVKGERLPFDDYLVGDSPSDFPISPSVVQRSEGVKKNTRRPSKQMKESSISEVAHLDADFEVEHRHSMPQTNSPPQQQQQQQELIATDITPLRNRRVSELAGGSGSSTRNVARQSLLSEGVSSSGSDSPHTPINNFGKASYNFDFMEKILNELDNDEERELVREVINEMRCNQTPELERIRRQACTPINGQERTPIGIPDFCRTPEFQKRMAEDFERRYRLPTKKIKPATPIDEIRKRVLRITCEKFGIPYTETSIKVANKTDVVSSSNNQNKLNSPLDEPSISIRAEEEEAESSASTLMSKTKTASAKSNNSSFNQDRSVGGDMTPVQHKSASHIEGRTLFLHTPGRESIGENAGHTTDNSFVPNTQSPGSIHMVNPITVLGKSTIDFDKISFEETAAGPAVGNASSRRSSSASSSSTTTTTAAATTAIASPEVKQIQEYLKNFESRRQSIKRAHHSNSKDMNCDLESEAHYVQPFESEQFGVGTENMVGWRDPTECSPRQRSRMSPTMQHKGTPRFSISCTEDLRAELIDKILHLGGEVCENLTIYDPTSTHFLCERPNRAEKMLGSIASGKWVLSIKYIDECYAKDVFIDEELFEWGNPKALNLPQLTTDEQTIVAAAHRWRNELNCSNESEGDGAFSGLRVILSIAERNFDAIKNVLKAGGAEIIDAKSPFGKQNKAQTATHCFVDIKKAPINAKDHTFLKEHNVLVLSQMYINAYLMNGKDVDKEKYQVTI